MLQNHIMKTYEVKIIFNRNLWISHGRNVDNIKGMLSTLSPTTYPQMELFYYNNNF